MFSLNTKAIAPAAMEQSPKPKIPNGPGDINDKSNALPKNGDIPSVSSNSAGIQAPGSLNDQNGGSTQTFTTSNKDEAEESKIVVDDPFHNERRRILFNAINELQSEGLHGHLDIPQASRFSSSNQGDAPLNLSLARSGRRAICWKVIFVKEPD
jgi:hypothetical protein